MTTSELTEEVATSSSDTIMLAGPVVTLLVLAMLRKGAFFTPDIVVSPVLTVALALTCAPVRSWLRAHPAAIAAGVLATGWWILDATMSHHGVDSWRLPATGICLAAGYGCARALPAAARTIALLAVTAVGGILAIAGLVLVGVHSTFWTWLDERSLRFSGPFTYPSAVGLFFVISLIASTEFRQVPTSRRLDVTATAVCSVTVLGVVATDSRGAVLGLVVALCFRNVRRQIGAAVVAAAIGSPLLLLGQRANGNLLLVVAAVVVAVALAFVPDGVVRRVLRVAAVPAVGVVSWLLLTQHHVVSGLDASWTERGNILRGSLTLFKRHILLGAGPDPRISAHTLAGQPGFAYFTHNEPVEILISVGVVGAVVLVGCAAVVVRTLRDRRGQLAMPVLISVALAGVVDFVWHFPALGLATGIVAGASHARRVARAELASEFSPRSWVTWRRDAATGEPAGR